MSSLEKFYKEESAFMKNIYDREEYSLFVSAMAVREVVYTGEKRKQNS